MALFQTRRRAPRLARAMLTGVATCLLLTACGSTPVTGSRPASSVPTHTFGVNAPDDPGVRVGPVDPGRELTLSLALAGQGAAPVTPGHFLSPGDYAKTYGPSDASRAQVAQWLTRHGFALVASPATGILVQARGSAALAERLFGVTLSDYRLADGRTYFATDRAATIPAELASVVIAIQGLSNRPLVHPMGIERLDTAGNHPKPQMLSPGELETAYNFKPLHQSNVLGQGQTIAFAEIDTFKQSDIDYYDHAYGLNTLPISVVKVGDGAGAAKQVSETTLDIEVAHAIAPQAKLIVYEGPSDFGSLLDIFNRIISDNKASVVSVSLGGCEPLLWQDSGYGQRFFSALNSLFQQAAAQGMTVFVSSGDSGAYTCRREDPSLTGRSASLPATNPFVTAVGGTALFLNDDHTYNFEAGWEGPLTGTGGGGGLSVGYARPSWQTGPGVENSSSDGARQVPDVAAAADPMTGYRIYDSTDGSCVTEECWGAVGGTSAAAPLWAALAALADQQGASQGKQRLGFINPLLYRLAGNGTQGLHDVTIGGNLGYQCAPGWDYSTGLGTPDAAVLISQLLQG
ncbi:MAG TPA: S53 family peptidase [Ktedonobacterales bacterium]